jgi:CRISPR-associated protein Csm4
LKQIYLTPRSSFRTDLKSDTLFGCVCWAIREVFSEEDLTGLLKQFAEGNPPFRLSSAFPFHTAATERKPFYPKPMLAPASLGMPNGVTEAARQKTFRKQKYVTEDVFQKFVTGEWGEMEYYKSGKWEKEGPELTSIDIQHNTIDRLSGGTTPSGNLYSLTEHMVSNGGLYFLMDGETRWVEGALGFLHHQGFGGDSSLGKGGFDIDVVDKTPIGVASGADRFVTLSLYSPRPDEVEKIKSGSAWYDLVLRKGKVGGPFLRVEDFWKRSVTMFGEGSTFALWNAQFFGHNPIVKGKEDGLPFDVQQYGYAFSIPMKTKVA